MKILIVNYYQDTNQGQQKFQQYLKQLKQLFQKLKAQYLDEVDIEIRSYQDLDDYLYDEYFGYNNQKCQLRLNQLDMVFIEGDPSIMPWTHRGQKLLILLNSCLKLQLNLFASQCACNYLIYLSSTANIRGKINVINGPQGSSLGEFAQIHKEVESLNQSDYFLDNITGDLYKMKSEEIWEPYSNVGMHLHGAAVSNPNLGQFMIKTANFTPKKFNSSQNYLGSLKEQFVKVKSYHSSHFLFKNLNDAVFMVQLNSQWVIHQIKQVDFSKKYVVLAEGKNGPSVFQFGQNIFACNFPIKQQYIDTLQIQENFITRIFADFVLGKLQKQEVQTENKLFQNLYQNEDSNKLSQYQVETIPKSRSYNLKQNDKKRSQSQYTRQKNSIQDGTYVVNFKRIDRSRNQNENYNLQLNNHTDREMLLLENNQSKTTNLSIQDIHYNVNQTQQNNYEFQKYHSPLNQTNQNLNFKPEFITFEQNFKSDKNLPVVELSNQVTHTTINNNRALTSKQKKSSFNFFEANFKHGSNSMQQELNKRSCSTFVQRAQRNQIQSAQTYATRETKEIDQRNINSCQAILHNQNILEQSQILANKFYKYNYSKLVKTENKGKYISLNKDLHKYRDENKGKWVGDSWLYY